MKSLLLRLLLSLVVIFIQVETSFGSDSVISPVLSPLKREFPKCPLSLEPCVDPLDEERRVCYRYGECSCGKCFCLYEPHYGKYCKPTPYKRQSQIQKPSKQNETEKNETKSHVQSDRCDELKDCVQCRVFQTGEYEDEKDCKKFCKRHPPLVKLRLNEDLTLRQGEKLCTKTDDSDGCRFNFVYGYYNNQSDISSEPESRFQIRMHFHKECPPEPPIFWIVVGILAGALIIGCCCISICIGTYSFRNRTRGSEGRPRTSRVADRKMGTKYHGEQAGGYGWTPNYMADSHNYGADYNVEANVGQFSSGDFCGGLGDGGGGGGGGGDCGGSGGDL